MIKFHPIYNNDGSIAYFRLICLIIAVVCFLIYAILALLKPTEASASSVEDVQENEQNIKIRRQALFEMADGYAFFKACGSINNSFSECSWSVSDVINDFYSPTVKAGEKDFSLSLAIKKDKWSDLCAAMRLNGKGEFKALDLEGKDVTSKCFPSDFLAAPQQ